MLAQVTAFTIAHSITLALGLYGVVSLSPRVVEPLIALSIVFVTVENLLVDRGEAVARRGRLRIRPAARDGLRGGPARARPPALGVRDWPGVVQRRGRSGPARGPRAGLPRRGRVVRPEGLVPRAHHRARLRDHRDRRACSGPFSACSPHPRRARYGAEPGPVRSRIWIPKRSSTSGRDPMIPHRLVVLHDPRVDPLPVVLPEEADSWIDESA